MKVCDLKKGMLLTCSNDNDCFSVYGENERWLRVKKPSRAISRYYIASENKVLPTRLIMYLGTKKDINIDMAWTDKFVLVDNEIVGVDPASWRRIKIASKNL